VALQFSTDQTDPCFSWDTQREIPQDWVA